MVRPPARSRLPSRAEYVRTNSPTNAESPSTAWGILGRDRDASGTKAGGRVFSPIPRRVRPARTCGSCRALRTGPRPNLPRLDFDRDIRPILAENCFYCHGQDANKRQADLRLDVREAAIASGAIVPKDPRASELICADQRDESRGADASPEVEPTAHARAEAAAGALDRRRGELRHTLGVRRSPATGRARREGRPVGPGTRSTASCSRSSRPKGCPPRPRPTGPP